ncbi:MAG: TonB-dependent receptor plug domain-containing protein, partial [Candidatus Solibacter sp.]|nr:TonB-dependent receptor plug domain-containing protein [Candidatus Solibacter sp.]
MTEQVLVTATTTPVQTASSEKSALVDGSQLTQVAIKSRDVLAMLALVPGAVSNSLQEVAWAGSIGGININGGGGGRNNFTVDGIVDLDTGSNGGTHFNPNMDSVAEVRVLTSNYQAEYGRMSSGQIAVITKGGGREFHGSAWANKRHEMFNAKNYFENYNNQPKSVYRFFVGGFSVGGPVYIPRLFNTQKQKLFFFVSQERTQQKPGAQVGYYNLPTAAMRKGDFSEYTTTTGARYNLIDPTTRVPIPNNQLSGLIQDPKSAAAGQAMLNFYPLPNRCDLAPNAPGGCYTPSDTTAAGLAKSNYRYMFNVVHPRSDTIARVDWNVTSKLTTWIRYGSDFDRQQTNGNMSLKDSQGNWTPYSEDNPNPGHGWGIGITYTISPTMVNEFKFGKSFGTWDFYAHDPGQLARANMANPPSWNNFATDPDFIADQNRKRPTLSPGSQNFLVGVPNVSYGGQWPNEPSFTPQRPYTNWNDIYSFNDGLSKVWGSHNLKAGFYYERTGKAQQAGQGSYLGSYTFGSSSSMPADTGDGYANAFLGNFQNYSEGKRVIGDFWFTQIEAYLQDNWRVSKRVTVDLGIRFYDVAPQANLNKNSATWVRANYNPAEVARIYAPYCTVATTTTCPSANQRGYDAATATVVPFALAGTFVPFTAGGYSKAPNYAPGMTVADGVNLPIAGFTNARLIPAPRIGLAWDVFGNGKTAVRTGFGMFYNRADGDQLMNMAGNPPVTLNGTIYYSSIAQVPAYADSRAVSPQAPSQMIVGDQKLEGTMSFSFGIQQNVGFGTVVETSYVGLLRRHIQQSRQMNAVPMFSQYNPAYYNPMFPGLYPNASGKAINDNYFRPIQGLGNFNTFQNEASQDYHSLQISVRRNLRHGLSFGSAYTWSKIMSGTSSPYWADKYRNWGPSYNGAPQVLVINYVYEVPGLGKKMNLKPLGWVTDNWELSGITQFRSNVRAGVPGISFTGTSTLNPAPNFTGSAESARMIVTGNPSLPSGQVSFAGATPFVQGAGANVNGTPGNQIINTSVFTIPMPCSWTPAATPQFGIGQNMAC